MEHSITPPPDENEVRICIVDDDEQLLDVVDKILTNQGYKILGVSNAIGSSSKINYFRPQILIMDLKMPAVSGQNLLDIFQETLNRMPKVIIFSGMDPQSLEQIAIDTRADDYVYKGDGIFRLLGRVNLHVQQMKMSGELKRKT